MSKFRTIEMSNPAFERDHLRFITVKTAYLKGRADICVFVPPGTSQMKDLPVTLLLHGVYGSAWSWPFCSGVHLLAAKMIENAQLKPMILAMPSDGLWGDGSAYLPHHTLNYEKWIAEDVPQALTECFPQVSEASAFFIAGLSMGGFGALRIGAKYHQRFKGMSGLSSITNLDQMKLFTEEEYAEYAQHDPVDESVLRTILANRDHLPPFRFDCGTDDLLIEHNRLLHQELRRQCISHRFQEFEGGHQWAYWEKHIAATLLFFNAIL
ncbi:alpha/beta hydrolase [Pedobacter nutrimenti]|uniref:S-formylglutathione hydrolase FrmB n=1 Tax=Pedobacter nutrimenti TaxID=1241337 RepID=A0A318UI49_9SPHI|nr:alpha/beta hydrolase-fold protein [Pedobacter nutrimenti]PYF74718.1 S-formylglutathione hydrolase FrmB [Pedobacter nutrimenti]